MRVYVAASSKELERAEAAMAKLRDAGHVVTHDWPTLVKAEGGGNPPGATRDERWDWAIDDLAGVTRADCLWLLYPNDGGAGAFVELGYALAKNIPVIVSGEWWKSIFTSMAVCYGNDEIAFDTEFGWTRPDTLPEQLSFDFGGEK